MLPPQHRWAAVCSRASGCCLELPPAELCRGGGRDAACSAPGPPEASPLLGPPTPARSTQRVDRTPC